MELTSRRSMPRLNIQGGVSVDRDTMEEGHYFERESNRAS